MSKGHLQADGGLLVKYNNYVANSIMIFHSLAGIQIIIKDLLLKRSVIISNCHPPSYSIGVQIMMWRAVFWGQHLRQRHNYIWICKIVTNSSNEFWWTLKVLRTSRYLVILLCHMHTINNSALKDNFIISNDCFQFAVYTLLHNCT